MHKSLYLHKIIYLFLGIIVLVFAVSYFFPYLYIIGKLMLALLLLAMLADLVLLYSRNGISGERVHADRFSIGDENKVLVNIKSRYSFPVHLKIIEELPFVFQDDKWIREANLKPQADYALVYKLTPTKRGEYKFGITNIYVSSPLRLLQRRYFAGTSTVVKVYPSYQQMRKYQLLAISNRLQEVGVKKVRRLGHSMEFEQVKEYVIGDDYRTVNWKATARKGDLMVNNYTDERSQQIYCIINKGRVMRMPFKGMYLLDYAINSALVLSNVALAKQDKAGLITVAENIDTFLPADRKPTQINVILESLYKQDTRFLEPDLEKLFSIIRGKITHRSLLVYFTNFESIESLERQLPSLKRIARYHLLLVVMFENTELSSLQQAKVKSLEDIYIKTIADKFNHEKKLMVKELQKNGITAVLTAPENLTVDAVNKYLELKTRMSI